MHKAKDNIPERLQRIPVIWAEQGVRHHITIGVKPSQYFNFTNKYGHMGLTGRGLLQALEHCGGKMHSFVDAQGEPAPSYHTTCLATGQDMARIFHQHGTVCDPEPGIPASQQFSRGKLVFAASTCPKGKSYTLSQPEIARFAAKGDFRPAHKPPQPRT